MNEPMRPASTFLGAEYSTLDKIQRRAGEYRTLNQALKYLLPSELHERVWVSQIRRGTLYIAADSPAWRERVRWHMPEIERSLYASFPGRFSKIRLVHRTSGARPPAPRLPARKKPVVTEKSARHVASAARSLEGTDDELAAVLRRLANSMATQIAENLDQDDSS